MVFGSLQSTSGLICLLIGAYIDNEIVDLYLIEKDVDLSTLKLQEEEVSEVKCIFILKKYSIIIWTHQDIHYTELEKMCLGSDPTLVHFYQPSYGQLFVELRKRYK